MKSGPTGLKFAIHGSHSQIIYIVSVSGCSLKIMLLFVQQHIPAMPVKLKIDVRIIRVRLLTKNISRRYVDLLLDLSAKINGPQT